MATSSESLERHLIALRSTVIATDDECFSHDCADGMVNGYRIDEAAASAGVRSLTELAEAVERRRETAFAVTERLDAAGLEVLGTGSNGAGARPNWRFLIGLAPSRERRDEIVSACRRAGLDVVMPVAAFTQQAQLHRRALPNTRVYCDLGLKLTVAPGVDQRLSTIL